MEKTKMIRRLTFEQRLQKLEKDVREQERRLLNLEMKDAKNNKRSELL